MKVENYQTPKSSFLSVEKDLSLITSYLLKNDRLKKLLYYTSKDCLSKPALTEEQGVELLNKNIKLVPKVTIDNEVINYLVVGFDNFATNGNNPEFRDNLIEFDIICHYDQWQLTDFQLRPYQIAGEIDSMFNNRRLTGIGKLQFLSAKIVLISDEYAGLCLIYEAIHGGEDKFDAPKPGDEEDREENFNKIFNVE